MRALANQANSPNSSQSRVSKQLLACRVAIRLWARVVHHKPLGELFSHLLWILRVARELEER